MALKPTNNTETVVNNGNTVKKPTVVRKRSFIKTPSFSEYLQRFENGEYDASKKPEIIFCGQQSPTKQLMIIIVLCVFFLISSVGVVVLWYTNVFENALLQNLVLSNNSNAFKLWLKPPVTTLLKVRIFNYTNVENYTKGIDQRLRVEEVGPYIYAESMERINVVRNNNGTVSYQEHRSYNFKANLSFPHRQHDKVIVPNIPLIGAVSMSKNSYFVTRFALNSMITTTRIQSFKTLPVDRYLWGYDDTLVNIGKNFFALKGGLQLEKFGLISLRNGTSRDRITIYTGETDINKLGMIYKFNGMDHTPYWSTEECNRVDGTDGAHFPLDSVHNLERIYIYNKELCRKLPLEFTESVMVKLDNDVEMPALRYRFPRNIFSVPDVYAENQCYCDLDSGVCPPEGVFNASPCVYGLPVYPSFPHFYLGDQKLINSVDGLKPDPEKHESYIDIHPNLGFPVSGTSRMQVNIQIRNTHDVQAFQEFEDGTFLPLAWLEVCLDELPNDVINLIYHATFSAETMKTVLRFLSLIIAGTTLSLLLTWLYANYTSKLYRRRLAEQIKTRCAVYSPTAQETSLVTQPIS